MNSSGPTNHLVATVSVVVLSIVGALPLPGCSPEDDESRHANVVLITIDTLRADHLSCYGYPKITSPHIDELSRRGALFERAYCPVPNTSASHSTIMTASYPRRHGVVKLGQVLTPPNRTLAEILKDNGYVTAAFVSGFALDSRFGVDQGFDSYVEVYEKKEFSESGMAPADRVNQHVLPWLRERTKEPFFLWVHYFDPHLPYSPPPTYAEQFSDGPDTGEIPSFKMREDVFSGRRVLSPQEVRAFVSKYDGEIRFTDRHVGLLLSELTKLGLDGNTLIVLTADHGEALHEHRQYIGHEYVLYDTSLRVPLVFAYPGVVTAGRWRSESVELVDILPTVLDALSVEDEAAHDGVSLLSLVSGDPSGNPSREIIFAETFPSQYHYVASARTNRWKFIATPKRELRELYDLRADPLERENVLALRVDIGRRLRAELKEWRLQARDRPAETLQDDETVERLKSLGYLR
jgi:arylsulfatase A-like enzyme